MSFSLLSKSQKVKQVSIEVVSLAIAMALLGEAASAAPSSWSSNPSWASSSESPPPSRKIHRDTNYNLAPFTPGSNNLSLDVGQVFLMGDLSSNYSDSIGAKIHYTYGVSDMFGFDASFGHSSHNEGEYSMTSLLTGLRMNLSWYDKVIPYANFGLGFFKPSYEIADKTGLTTMSPVLFGLHLGPGVNLELTRQLFFGASLTFHDVFGTRKTTSTGKIMEVDGTYTSFFLQAGVTF